MSKIFVFGTARGDVKGKDDERGTVAVQAPTRDGARAAFVKAFGTKDPRVGVMRLPRVNEHVDQVVHAPEVTTSRENGTVTSVGPVTVHDVPAPAKDQPGDVAAVFASLNAGNGVPGAKAKAKAKRPKKAG